MSEAVDWVNMPLAQKKSLWKNLANYCQMSWPPHFKIANHQRYLCREIMKATLTPGSRLIVSAPPRTAKSDIISVTTPAWYLAQFPDQWIIQVSSTADLAQKRMGVGARETMRRMEAVTDVGVSKSIKAIGQWRTLSNREGERDGGGMVSVGAMGTIIGIGANLILLDDLVKNNQMAFSLNEREKLWDWYQNTLRTRLEPGGSIIVIMQRWHEDDIVGKLLKAAEHGGEKWDYIRLPAIAEEDEVWYEGKDGPVGRLKGELLWPDRITEKELAETRMGVGEYGWQAAYQQNPQPLDGVLFRQEDFGHWVAHELFYELRNGYGVTKSVAKNTCRRIMSLDMAGSDAARADYSAIQVWDVTPRGEMILLFSDRMKAKFPDLKKRVTELYLAHRPAYILAENNGMQNAICDDLLSSGLPISKQPPISSKEVRAQPLLMKYQEKYIYHPDEIYGYTWAREYEYELLKFPMGRYDDQVDAASLVGADVRSLTDAGDTNYLAGTPLSVNSGIGGF